MPQATVGAPMRWVDDKRAKATPREALARRAPALEGGWGRASQRLQSGRRACSMRQAVIPVRYNNNNSDPALRNGKSVHRPWTGCTTHVTNDVPHRRGRTSTWNHTKGEGGAREAHHASGARGRFPPSLTVSHAPRINVSRAMLVSALETLAMFAIHRQPDVLQVA